VARPLPAAFLPRTRTTTGCPTPGRRRNGFTAADPADVLSTRTATAGPTSRSFSTRLTRGLRQRRPARRPGLRPGGSPGGIPPAVGNVRFVSDDRAAVGHRPLARGLRRDPGRRCRTGGGRLRDLRDRFRPHRRVLPRRRSSRPGGLVHLPRPGAGSHLPRRGLPGNHFGRAERVNLNPQACP